MDELRIVVSCTIASGKTDAFKATAGQLLAAVRERDPGTSRYDWFLSPDGARAKIQETYSNSEALMAHMSNMGVLLERLVSLCSDVTIDVLGDPSPQVREAIAPFNPTIYSDAFQLL